ncbi:N-acetylneuraminate synthase family protein [Candidatus Nitrosotenuis chungbukensis]|uniref:N-acetylneuraminate synthase family protein n=1 Tax=Candidatus Nitrosotenuis chungbukensis TaxID=1353246 RepID=UPI0005B2B982|nr:N-acetylneuraminate synthase family protein [Candidatus Nitrosotenuis chungbukensis]
MFIVAEIGVNWDGDFEHVRIMIENAKKSGCDAVKFQAFDEKLVREHEEFSRLLKCTITADNVEQVNDLAKEIGIEWFCTPMYKEAVDFLDPFVKRYKIREMDGRVLLQNKMSPLIERVIETGKEIIISAQQSPKNSTYYQSPQIKWLYCVPKYPSEISDHDFTHIKDFDGFSNHCPHYLVPLSAAILGSKILEIHVTIDKIKNFVDNAVSYDFNELAELIKLVRLSEKIIK